MEEQDRRTAGASERVRRQVDRGVTAGLLLWVSLGVVIVVVVGIAILVLKS